MPSILHMHGFRKGVRTVKLDATSASNPSLVVRVPRAQATAAAIAQRRTSVVASSRTAGAPILVRPRDTLTVFVDDKSIVMLVLGVYPLAALCQRHGVIDRAILLLAIA